jgi:hypothetical protein
MSSSSATIIFVPTIKSSADQMIVQGTYHAKFIPIGWLTTRGVAPKSMPALICVADSAQLVPTALKLKFSTT